MKILVLNYEYPPLGGGAGIVTRELCRGFAARGHFVKVITSRMRGLESVSDDCGVEVFRTPADRRRREKSDYLQMACYLAGAMPRLFRLLKTWRPDIIHSHFIMPTSVLAYLSSRFFGVPYVITVHGGDVPSNNQAGLYRILGLPAKSIGKHAAAAVPVSKSLEDTLIEDFPIFRGKTRHIPNGIHLSGSEAGPGPAVPTFLFCGRLAAIKNVEFLLEALKDETRDYSLIILGDGPVRFSLEQMAGRCARRENITFEGWMSAEEVRKRMREAHCLVMPSLKEGMPMALLQAYDNALPVVGTRVPGIEEHIVNGDTGFLVDVGDAKNLNKRLFDVTDRTLRERMGRACREFAKGFEWSRIADEYLELFTEILCKAPGRRRAVDPHENRGRFDGVSGASINPGKPAN